MLNKPHHINSRAHRYVRAQPSSNAFAAKPDIRNAGLVDVTFGENVTIVQTVNLYGCVLGDETFVELFVEIQKGSSDRQTVQNSITCIYL